MYSDEGRPSIAPERLLKSELLIALYSIRSERQFCEMAGYNILFRWFLGMSMDEKPFHATTFSKNRERLLEHEVAYEFLQKVVEIARKRNLLSPEHFSVDGTLIESWASIKSFRSNDDDDSSGGGKRRDVNYHGEKRSNKTHTSTTDPEAKLMRKGLGKEAKLSFCGNVITENRSGLVVEAELVQATGKAEIEAAMIMLERLSEHPDMKPKTLAADKGYHTTGMVDNCRNLKVIPHIAQRCDRNITGLDGRTTRHRTYWLSQRKRKLTEEVFGYTKSVAGKAKSRFIGVRRNAFDFLIKVTAYNIVRIARVV
jgi:transposase